MSLQAAQAAPPVSMPADNAGAHASLWQRCRRWVLPLLGVAVLGLLLSHAHKVDWAGAWQALQRYSPWLLLAVLGLATASHALYGCFDLIGRRHLRHRLPWWRTWAIAVTSYAFNLNLGSLVGGIAMRARLYARAGLDDATVAQVVGLSLLTNWLGYGLLAGGLFAAGVIEPPRQAHIGQGALRALGVAMILLALGYVAACAVSRKREWAFKGKRLRLPNARIAVTQLALSTANWALMGTAMYLLLGQNTSCVCVTCAHSRPVSPVMEVCQTCVVRPLCSGTDTARTVVPTLAPAMNLVLESVVVVILPGGRLTMVPTAPSASANAM
jgi:uncharacterized membrane protein YbhN (UPF0104 family)